MKREPTKGERRVARDWAHRDENVTYEDALADVMQHNDEIARRDMRRERLDVAAQICAGMMAFGHGPAPGDTDPFHDNTHQISALAVKIADAVIHRIDASAAR